MKHEFLECGKIINKRGIGGELKVDCFCDSPDSVKGTKVMYSDSEGKNAYILTKDVLPGIMKLKADNIFKTEYSNIEEESSVIAEFIPKNENDYTIKCKIVENNETIFEVRTFAGSRDRAKRIVDNWNSNATTIYPKILNLLLNDDSQV